MFIYMYYLSMENDEKIGRKTKRKKNKTLFSFFNNIRRCIEGQKKKM